MKEIDKTTNLLKFYKLKYESRAKISEIQNALSPEAFYDCINISEKEYNKINDICCRVCQMNKYLQYTYMVIAQVNDFLSKIHHIDYLDPFLFGEVNRLLMNVLNQLYSWCGVVDRYFEDEINPIRTSYYDDYFEYRLIYNLRNFMTHRDLALNYLEIDLIDNGYFLLAVNIEKLLDSKKKISPSFIADLEMMNNHGQKYIDIIGSLEGFSCLFSKLAKEGFDAVWEGKAKDGIPYVLSIIPEDADLKRPCYAIIEDEDQNPDASISVTAPISALKDRYFILFNQELF